VTVAGTLTADRDMMAMVVIVRNYLRDHTELNRLIDGEESSDRMVAWAVLDCLDDFTNTPPLIGNFSLHTVPKSMIIRGAAIALLESVGILQTRNNLRFSDGGISLGVSDKAPIIMNWINLLRASYDQKKIEYKIAKNIQRAWGSGVHSEYWSINGMYGGW